MNQITFSPEELSRYSRHIALPQFGVAAQQKLKAANVLVVGCGGLGSPLLLYLAAAGVGSIGLVDFDRVDESNLQRQVLFDIHDIGEEKAVAAQHKIKALNPHINTRVYAERLTAANAMNIIKEYDVVADGTDNFTTRYLVNDACVLLNKPYVYAAIHQFEGQVSLFNCVNNDGETGPNYRDLFPLPPAPEAVPNCGEAGVLGVLPGIIGSMQALEVIKVITGIGETLSGRLFIFDTLYFQTNIFKIKRNADNPLNGTHPTITQLIDCEPFCNAAAKSIKEITPQQLKDWQQHEAIQLIDVREPYEYEIVNMGAQLIPLNTITNNIATIDRTKKVVLHCKSGSRSLQAIQLLEKEFGFTNLYNLQGGILQYIDEMAPHLTKY
ncbi:molybdopterin-synthase adenylyltransferase MoeB [Ilyomonas limi]|uniref:Molybdopterin-synthase adenylyltransferase n=1 Tax=Ilyomonas limi TaxID=2575867 RepID=A0A4U3L7P8_9BACT|nr:molybdopterin-synthase adenylyltransferase MoeB [Ilyomonas limi]